MTSYAHIIFECLTQRRMHKHRKDTWRQTEFRRDLYVLFNGVTPFHSKIVIYRQHLCQLHWYIMRFKTVRICSSYSAWPVDVWRKHKLHSNESPIWITLKCWTIKLGFAYSAEFKGLISTEQRSSVLHTAAVLTQIQPIHSLKQVGTW